MHHLHSLHHSTSCNKLSRIVVQIMRRIMGRRRKLVVIKLITHSWAMMMLVIQEIRRSMSMSRGRTSEEEVRV